MASRAKKASSVAPDKGSFPLDHFKECQELVEKYMKCINKHELMPKRCQNLQKEYLECRMKAGLMSEESLENLGFTQENTLQAENDKKKELFHKFMKINGDAQKNVEEYYKNLYKDSEKS